MSMPDGSKLLMSKIENAGTPERVVTIYITQEQRQQFNDKAMENASKMMSPYYDDKGVFCLDGLSSI